jgi:hypothetical protein
MHIGGSGSWSFTVPPDELSVSGEAPFTGSGTVSDSSCIIADVTDPLRFEITFSEDGKTADVILGSRGGGTTTILCRDDPPITIPFAIAWGPTPLTVPLTEYEGCP